MRSGTHANRGRTHELDTESWLATYESQGAYVQKNPRAIRALASMQPLNYTIGRPPGARQMSGQAFPAVYESESPPDYLVLVAGLPAMLLDAKKHNGDRWPLDKLDDHQARAFDRWEANRGRAFILLRLDDPTTGFPIGRWLLPWTGDLARLWKEANAGGTKRGNASLTSNDCTMIGAPLASGDWLPTAWRLWGVTLSAATQTPAPAATPKIPLYALVVVRFD